ncbi:MAG: amidohydrolase family protein [Candidatus Sungbacteria bacterium]|nr:amidohydrolase family protein [Candidatus Sungbacteria bacterium]
MSYDILIKSGSVVDGTGKKPEVFDVGVSEDKIADIGHFENADAKIIINAAGKFVTPGFIDITNHSDTHLTLFREPGQESLVMQGITSVIGGNCGASLAPLASMQAIHAIKKWADPSEINCDWSTTKEFLDRIETMQFGVNFGTFAGFGTMRRGVIGDEIRALNTEEQNQIKLLASESLSAGAFGISFGLSYGHERASTTEELIEITRVMQGTKGVAKLHLRSEGTEILAAVNETIRIGREAGVPVHISHLKAIGKKAWELVPKVLELIDNARASGLNIMFDVSPYHTTGSLLYLLLPPWAREGGFAGLFQRIERETEREKMMEELQRMTLHYDKILITSAKIKDSVGRTIKELADEAGLTPEETVINLVRANEGRVNILGRTVSAKNTVLQLQNPNSLLATDGEGYRQEEFKSGNLVHPRSFGALPHFWHRFVMDRELLSPEAAIQKATGGPAVWLGIKNRGVIAKGNFADIVVFDSQLYRDRSTYRNPYRYPAGMEWVVLNGKVAVEQGKHMNARAGRVLRRE